MGNSCSQQNQHGNHRNKPVHPASGNSSALHRRPASSVAPSYNRSGNPGMTSSGEVGYNQRMQGGQLTIPCKIQTAFTEDQKIPSVTNPASPNQTDESHTPCKSEEVSTEDQQIALVTTAASTNQTDEPHMPCQSPKPPNEDQQIAPVTTAATTNQTDEPHTPCQSPEIPNEDQQITPVTNAANANQTDEPHTLCQSPEIPKVDQYIAPAKNASSANQADEPVVLKINEDKDALSGCNFEAAASKELERTSTFEDEYENECPTCLEGYDEENPKIMTECNHHYHLACIFEWMERSETCPVCNKVMIIVS